MEIIDLEMIPGGPKKTCHASQFDNGRVIRFNLKENGQPFALSGTETVQAIIRKPDGTEKTLNIANTSSTYVDLITEADTCDLAGVNHCEMKVTEDGEDLGSGNFDMKVEEDAYGGGDITTGEASGKIASFETNIKDDLIECVCEINPEQDLHGEDKPYPAGGGVNLWDEEWLNGYYAPNNGNYSANRHYICSKNLIRVSPSTQYYVHSDNNILIEVLEYRIDGTFIRRLSSGTANETITTDNDCAYIHIGTHEEDVITTYTSGISINYPSTDHDYHPYENICPINGYTEANITRCGVNLWDEEWELGTFIGGVLQPSTTRIRNKMPIPVKPNTTYRLVKPSDTVYVMQIDKATGWTQYSSSATSGTFTTASWCNYLYMSPDTTYGTTYNNDISINYPATDTTYHPYNGQTYIIAFGQTVYGGVLDVTRGKLTITHASKTFIGSAEENWSLLGSGSASAYCMKITVPDKKSNTPSKANYLESILPGETWGNYDSFISYGISDGTIYTGIRNITSVSDWKTYLSSNPLIIAYELATPFDIDLTPEQIETLVGQKNNVYHNANGDTAVKFYIRA